MDELTPIALGFLAFVAAMVVMIVTTDRPQLHFSLRDFLIAMAFATIVVALVAVYARF